ncbi:MAG: HAD family hydrolase [Bryobacterales bacterium]|nr:HAD family hydrolase [Bryobacteraceae bacterium]MDW8353313.1 HAD family hydrolase [Bryobacterales bacterium]
MGQHLLIDADDTLWENNIYFERAIQEFVRLLDHPQLQPAEIRAVLDQIEHANRKTHGYGSRGFVRNLRECYLRLTPRGVRPEDLEAIEAIGERLTHHPIDVLEGVPETLAYLAERHWLVLLTKGDPEEQHGKLKRSGLAPYFSRTIVAREKDVQTYRELIGELRLVPERTWMVGNSPRSDINPALQAGLRAVYIPHPHTWHLEHEEIRDGDGRVLQLARFAQLREHF